MPEMCGDTVGDRPKGTLYFLLAGDLVENAPIVSPLLLGHFPKCIHYSVSIAEKPPILSGHFHKSYQYPFGTAQKVLYPLGTTQMVQIPFMHHSNGP
jgi:hypothetical protein